MKKIILTALLLLSLTMTVFAGSIPEDISADDDAKLYIGTVEDFTTEEIPSAPYIKVITLVVKPSEKIKGDVKLGETITYKDTNIYADLQQGTDYLIADLDEHNIYAYEIKSKTDDKIELVNSDIYDMTQRIEQNINDGSYAAAEKERQNRVQQKSSTESNDATVNEDTPVTTVNVPLVIGLVVAGLLVVVIILLIAKRRK